MFDKQIIITGRHAKLLKKYSPDKQADEKFPFLLGDDHPDSRRSGIKEVNLFENMMQCYMVSAMIGIIEKKCVSADLSVTAEATIFADMVNKNRTELQRIYYHMILSEESELTLDARVKKAFSIILPEQEKDVQKAIDGYVRGGLEIIDSYFGECKSCEELAQKIYDLLQQYSEFLEK